MDGSDAELVARARSGDESAYEVLVRRHSRPLFRLAYRMTGNEQDAEDVVQDAFLKAWRRLSQFEERANFSTWLYRVAANCALDSLRSRIRRERHLERPDPGEGEGAETDRLDAVSSAQPSPERLLISSETQRRIALAMARLSQRERAAFVLRHFEEWSTQEIGVALGLEEGAAKHSVFRAVRKLREALRPLAAHGLRSESL